MQTKYVVVENVEGNKKFSKWHETIEEAKAEANRLCQKEQAEFLVLEVVGRYFIEQPAKWESAND